MQTLQGIETQRGAVLVVSMILLLVMTTLALAASRSTRLQERMAGNMRDSDLAFQAAEAALRDGERMIADQTAIPVSCSSVGAENASEGVQSQVEAAGMPCNFFQHGSLPADLASKSRSWWNSHGRQYMEDDANVTGEKKMQDLAEDPRSIVEEIAQIAPSLAIGRGAPVPGRTYYRVTAHGTGGTTTAEAVVESTYSRPF